MPRRTKQADKSHIKKINYDRLQKKRNAVLEQDDSAEDPVPVDSEPSEEPASYNSETGTASPEDISGASSQLPTDPSTDTSISRSGSSPELTSSSTMSLSHIPSLCTEPKEVIHRSMMTLKLSDPALPEVIKTPVGLTKSLPISKSANQVILTAKTSKSADPSFATALTPETQSSYLGRGLSGDTSFQTAITPGSSTSKQIQLLSSPTTDSYSPVVVHPVSGSPSDTPTDSFSISDLPEPSVSSNVDTIYADMESFDSETYENGRKKL